MVRYRCQKGLTLWEVITVVGVIAILAVIIAMVALNVRRQSHGVACASNLRQIALAAHMYVADYGTLPAGWSFYIEPYVKDRRIFVCPADKLNVPLQKLDSSYSFFDIQGYYDATSFYSRHVRTHDSVQLDPNFVLVLCEHHMGWRVTTLTSPSGSHSVYDNAEMPPHPYLQVLRYNGAVQRVHLCRVRKLWGVDLQLRLRVFFPVFPDMEDYEHATGFYYENTCNRGAL